MICDKIRMLQGLIWITPSLVHMYVIQIPKKKKIKHLRSGEGSLQSSLSAVPGASSIKESNSCQDKKSWSFPKMPEIKSKSQAFPLQITETDSTDTLKNTSEIQLPRFFSWSVRRFGFDELKMLEVPVRHGKHWKMTQLNPSKIDDCPIKIDDVPIKIDEFRHARRSTKEKKIGCLRCRPLQTCPHRAPALPAARTWLIRLGWNQLDRSAKLTTRNLAITRNCPEKNPEVQFKLRFEMSSWESSKILDHVWNLPSFLPIIMQKKSRTEPAGKLRDCLP